MLVGPFYTKTFSDFWFLMQRHQKSEITPLVLVLHLCSGRGDSSKFIVAVQVDLVPCFSGRGEAMGRLWWATWVFALSYSQEAAGYDVQGQHPPSAHHRAPRISRRHAVRAATVIAVVLAAVGIIANSVIAIASSVASIGGPQRLPDWEEEQVLLPVRQEEQVLLPVWHAAATASAGDGRRFFAISVQAYVSASYKDMFVTAMHAGSTHDSTAFLPTSLHAHLSTKDEDGGRSSWAHVAADDV
jgi:hypothetical protein